MTIRHLYPAVEPSLNLDFANSKKLDSRITFTRASTGTYIDESGIIRTAAANEARFDHDGDGNSLGLLIEESRTNYFTNSSNPTWTTLNSGTGTLPTITAVSDAAPDGTTNSVQRFQFDRGAGNTAANFSLASYIATVASDFYSNTLWMKSNDANSYTIQMYDANGGIGNEFVVTPTWQRFSIDGSTTFKNSNHTATTAPMIVFGLRNQPDYNSYPVGNTNSQTADILAWGPQIEAGSFPTSYIPTSGSTVTRSADVASMTGTNFSSWYNNNEGSLFFTQKTSTSPTQSTYYYLINSGSTVNGYRLARQVIPVDISGANAWSSTASWLDLYPESTFQNMAFAYTDGSAATAKNGAILETNTEALADVSPTLLRIAYNVTSTISRLTYYPVRLPDATLRALTL